MDKYNNDPESLYEEWHLDIMTKNLSPKDWDLILAADLIVQKKKVLRQVSKELDIPLSSLHKGIHRRLPIISSELYCLVCKQFKINLENGRRKGGVVGGKRKQERVKI